MRDFGVKHRRPLNTNKVYYSHSRIRNGRTFGEDKLERYFASKGYTIVYPERISFDDQLNILINCESFASTIGSCSHNMLFLRDDTEVILIPRSNYLESYQTAIDQVHRMRISYVDSSFSIFTGKSPWNGPFLYFVSRNLREFFHDDDTNHIIDASDFRKYLRASSGYSFGKSFGRAASADSPDVYRYYSKTATEYFSQMFRSSWPHRLTWLDRIRKFLKKLIRRK